MIVSPPSKPTPPTPIDADAEPTPPPLSPSQIAQNEAVEADAKIKREEEHQEAEEASKAVDVSMRALALVNYKKMLSADIWDFDYDLEEAEVGRLLVEEAILTLQQVWLYRRKLKWARRINECANAKLSAEIAERDALISNLRAQIAGAAM